MNKKILALAIPSIISNISIPLLSAVDTMLMGHLSTLHLTALGIVSMMFLFIYGTLNFLRKGTTGITAQAYGRNDRKEMSLTLYRGLIVAFVLAFIVLFFRDEIQKFSFYMMNVDSSYEIYAKNYFELRIFTAPAVFMLYVLMGWFFGMQNAIFPLIITVVINFSNIVLSYYFVNVLHMGIEGTAYGTIIAQYIGLVLGFILLYRYRTELEIKTIEKIMERSELFRFLHVNRDIFLRTAILTFVFAFFYAQSAKHSTETLAMMVLLLQFVTWFAYVIDGFANAAESLVGKYYGVGNWSDVLKMIKSIFYWGFIFSLCYMAIYYFCGEYILRLYTNQEKLIAQTLLYLPYVVILPLLSFVAYIWDGVFIGMTATRALRDSVFVATLLFLLLFYVLKEWNFTLALWGSFMSFFFFRGALQTLLFFWKKQELK